MKPGDLAYFINDSWDPKRAHRLDCLVISKRGETRRGTNIWDVLIASTGQPGIVHEDKLIKIDSEA